MEWHRTEALKPKHNERVLMYAPTAFERYTVGYYHEPSGLWYEAWTEDPFTENGKDITPSHWLKIKPPTDHA